jgi:hypothetical protein
MFLVIHLVVQIMDMAYPYHPVLRSTGGIVDSQEHYYATAACTA